MNTHICLLNDYFSCEDFKVVERFLRDKKRTLLSFETNLKLDIEKQNYKKIYAERLNID